MNEGLVNDRLIFVLFLHTLSILNHNKYYGISILKNVYTSQGLTSVKLWLYNCDTYKIITILVKIYYKIITKFK